MILIVLLSDAYKCQYAIQIQNYSSLKLQNFISLKIQNFISLKIQNFISLKIPNFISLKIQNFISLKIQNFISLKIQKFISLKSHKVNTWVYMYTITHTRWWQGCMEERSTWCQLVTGFTSIYETVSQDMYKEIYKKKDQILFT